jgi:hypothetical protein
MRPRHSTPHRPAGPPLQRCDPSEPSEASAPRTQVPRRPSADPVIVILCRRPPHLSPGGLPLLARRTLRAGGPLGPDRHPARLRRVASASHDLFYAQCQAESSLFTQTPRPLGASAPSFDWERETYRQRFDIETTSRSCIRRAFGRRDRPNLAERLGVVAPRGPGPAVAGRPRDPAGLALIPADVSVVGACGGAEAGRPKFRSRFNVDQGLHLSMTTPRPWYD